jgi:hypothetical protein
MDRGRIKITDVKAPKERDVRGRVRLFEIDDRGSEFKPTTEWITEEEEHIAFPERRNGR